MRKLLLGTAALVVCALPFVVLQAQQAAPNATPTATPNMCDQTFSGVIETSDGDLVGYIPGATGMAQPYADIEFYHKEQVKIVSAASKEQNKNGPYTITLTETTTCDGGATKRIADGSIYVEGVTYEGMNRIAREALKSADAQLKRHEDRAKAGAKTAWNHKNGPKVARDRDGSVLPPGQAKKQ